MASRNNLLWIAISGGVSAGVAVYLYATRNGRAIKKDLKRKKELLMDKTNEGLTRGKKKAKSFIKEAKKHGEEMSKELSKTSENYLVPAKKKIRNHKRPY